MTILLLLFWLMVISIIAFKTGKSVIGLWVAGLFVTSLCVVEINNIGNSYTASPQGAMLSIALYAGLMYIGYLFGKASKV